MWLGLVAWRLGEYRDARDLGEQSLRLKVALDLSDELSRSQNALGLLALSEGRLTDAAKLFGDATRSALTHHDTAGVSRAAGNLGLVYAELGDFDRARAGFEQLRDAGRALGDARSEGNALNNLGMLSVKVGDPMRAVLLLEQARERYASIGYAEGQQNALAQLATAYMELGQPHDAFAMLDSALQVSRANGMRAEEATNLRLLAEFYQFLGDHTRAIALFEQAAAISSALDMTQETGVLYRAQARSYSALGRPALARDRALAALQAHDAGGAASEMMDDLLIVAELVHAGGDAAGAAGYVGRARRLAQQLGSPGARADLALTEARISWFSGEDARVLTLLTRALPELASARSRGLWEAHLLRSRAFARMGMLDSAISAGRQAFLATERVRQRIGSAPLRTTYTSERTAAYVELVLLLLRAGEVSAAFEVADAARGRALSEHLAAAQTAVSGVAVPNAAEREALLRRIDQLTDMLRASERLPVRERGVRHATASYLAEQLALAEHRYEELILRRGTGTSEGVLVSTRAVQRSLLPDELLVEYLVTPAGLVIFALTSDSVREFTVAAREQEIAARVRLARELIRQPLMASRSKAVLAELHRLLVLPLQRSGMLHGKGTLTVVPHASLSYLPFAALQNAETGRYLVEDIAVLVQPSAAALPSLRARRGREGSHAPRTTVFAPFPRALPATREEARSVSRELPRAQELVGRAASERRLRDALASSTVVHVASHGVLNARNPLFSRVELAPGPSATGSRDDGEFAVHEIVATRITSELIFLSGCETGVGISWATGLDRGEDYATLGQAFVYAGAGGVIATLWRVEDEGAAAFARTFYEGLAGSRPSVALADAQRRMLRHPAYAAPFYWAGYQLAGSDRIAFSKMRSLLPFT